MSTQPIPDAAPDPLSMGEVLRIGALRRMWYAQIVSAFGDFLALFAVISVLTFRMHANAQQVTALQIFYLLPIALLGVLSGVFVDRWPLKPTLVASDLTRAALCLLLLRVHNIYGFYAVLASISVFSSFFSPAQGVAIRGIVPLHGLRSANALMQQVLFLMRIVGPFAAGALVGWLGPRFCYWADSASFIASASLILTVPLLIPDRNPLTAEAGPPAIAAHEKTGLPRIASDMREGSAFILGHPALLFVIVALAAAMFVMGCFGPLIAVYVRDNLHRSIQTFTAASALIGVGLFAGVNLLNIYAKRVSNSLQVYCGLAGIASGTLLMAAVPHVLAAWLGCFLIGFTCAGIIVPSQTMIQQETPAALLGRVGSTTMSAVFSSQIAGLILSGILASHTSVRRVFFLCTLMLAALIAIGKLWMEPGHPATA